MGYKKFLVSLKPIFMAASVIRGTNLMPQNIVLSNEHICTLYTVDATEYVTAQIDATFHEGRGKRRAVS